MTTKRDSKNEPKKARPKIKKETLRDLDPKDAEVTGGAAGPETGKERCTQRNTTCGIG